MALKTAKKSKAKLDALHNNVHHKLNHKSKFESSQPKATFCEFGGQRHFAIRNAHLLSEFFTQVVSSQNHWMFITSRGALTAGRQNPSSALFPYYCADKIIDLASSTGPRTIVRQHFDGQDVLWEPFCRESKLNLQFQVKQNLYKSVLGDRIVFEEINEMLQLSFQYSWAFSNRFGFVRRCRLSNLAKETRSLSLIDGLENILPSGLEQAFQLKFSNLGDAYKKNELLADSRLGIYYLSSVPTDRAEPNEGLRATVVWSHGLDDSEVLLSSRQLDTFAKTGQVETEHDMRGVRGAYFLSKQLRLSPEQEINWTLVAELHRDQTDVLDIDRWIRDTDSIDDELDRDLANGENELAKVISSSDGFQFGNELRQTHRHQSNVLFNVMRGGIPIDGYRIPKPDFLHHVKQANIDCYDRNEPLLQSLPAVLQHRELLDLIRAQNDEQLIRIGLEYLPFTYSRRHGDPTRPWNEFSIDVLEPNGERKLQYQGNWRDIFQNWEALAISYPEYTSAMVFRFLNASTADGHNPYRITKDGFEWEVVDPEDPWSNIGYWGDHQIIYLCRLLEKLRNFAPLESDPWLTESFFAYANVPYRIREYQAILEDPRKTIDFDLELSETIDHRVRQIGSDGKLLADSAGNTVQVTMFEKLLVPILAKLTNFVPEGGIWLNTQRPEWNDANNALVGNGLSVVTTCDLRRYLCLLRQWMNETDCLEFCVSVEVASLFDQHLEILRQHRGLLSSGINDEDRRNLTDRLSENGSAYRVHLYANGFSGDRRKMSVDKVRAFLDVSIAFLDHTLRSNRRHDGLYHSYNLVEFNSNQLHIRRLHEMLEGQVAILNSGLLPASEAADLLDALRQSAMYREDQQSYMLYPDRDLPRFVDKNRIPEESVSSSPLLSRLLENDDESIIRRDVEGGYHFNGDLRNSAVLEAVLRTLAEHSEYAGLVENEIGDLKQLFEATFQHHEFTGRSGTFFAYEGLGSIYWHMVSKLRLAVVEYLAREIASSDQSTNPSSVEQRLRAHYQEICYGIGATKSPCQYGAFPTEPYSHTPRHAGAQQPGMTGQVKEDILARYVELGVRVNAGQLSFDLSLFNRAEFLQHPTVMRYFDTIRNQWNQVPLAKNQFGFTICQVPVVFAKSANPKMIVHCRDGKHARSTFELTRAQSQALFAQDGLIEKIEVQFT